MPQFAFASPEEALAALEDRLSPVGTETVPLREARGRALARALRADRPNPPCDVSAMDGYVLRMEDLARGGLPVAGEVRTGRPPPDLPPRSALRIFTGGAVPAAGEAVIPRERLIEEPEGIRFPGDLEVSPGQHIRRKGENVAAGEEVLAPGRRIGPQTVSSLAAFGAHEVEVRRRLAVSVVITGDEIVGPFEKPADSEVRDSNGPALQTLLGGNEWIDFKGSEHVSDDPASLEATLRRRLSDVNAVILSGGVSMGDHDHVEEVLAAVGADIVFHWLPIRPGKPILAAIGPRGQLILGLPGNPLSVLVTARRFGIPALAKLAGLTGLEDPRCLLSIENPDARVLGLFWHRLVRRRGPETADLVPDLGSGDVAALARSDGFVCVKPDQRTEGRLPFYSWRP